MQKERPLEIAQPVNKEVQQAKQFYVEKNAEIEDLIKKVMEKEKPQVEMTDDRIASLLKFLI